MDIVVAIERITLVSIGSTQWTPKTHMVSDVECVVLCPNDKGFVSLVAETAGISLKGKSRMGASLANVEGFVDLKELRDRCQVAELQGSGRKAMLAEDDGGPACEEGSQNIEHATSCGSTGVPRDVHVRGRWHAH